MYSAMELSRYIVKKCIRENHPISNLQLQKILYYIQKHFLRQEGKQAFYDNIEAWQFGPVVPNVFYRYCGFGAMPIIVSYNDDTNLNNRDRNTIDDIVNSKRILNPWDMVEETHRPDGAWAKTLQDGVGNHRVISVDLIRAVG